MAYGFSSGFAQGLGSRPRLASVRASISSIIASTVFEQAARRVAVLTLPSGLDNVSEMPYQVAGSPMPARYLGELTIKLFPIDTDEDSQDQELSAWLEYASPGEEIDPTLGDDHPPDSGAVWAEVPGSVVTLDTSVDSSPAKLRPDENNLLNDKHWVRLVLEVISYTGATDAIEVSAELWASADEWILENPYFSQGPDAIAYPETDIEQPEDARNDLT